MGKSDRSWHEAMFHDAEWLAVQTSTFSEGATAVQAADVAARLGLRTGERVLDMPCGEGRLTRALAARGMDVVGLDFSAPLLEMAAERTRAARAAGRLHGSVDYVEGDMRAPAKALAAAGQSEPFDALVCFWSSFGYFGEADNHRHARAMVRCLRPGGRALIDTHTTECLFPSWAATDAYPKRGDASGRTTLEQRRYDPTTGVITVTWTFIDSDSGAKRHAETRVRLYGAPELHQLLRESGFGAVDFYDGLSGRRFGVGSNRCLVVATR